MRKIPVALLAYGMSGKVFHAPFLTSHSGFSLIGAWERKSKKIKLDYPEAISFNSIEGVLQSEAELVIVNTPNDTHFEFTKACLKHGKNVVVEKAFTTSLSEAMALEKLASEKRLLLSVFQNRRWDSDFLTVKKVLHSEILGKIVEARMSYDRFNAALSPKVHKETPTPGAGVLKDLGPHLIDQALQLFGFPNAVFADLRITRPESRIEDCMEVILYYNHLRVFLHSGYFVYEPGPSYILHGTNGSFLKTRSDRQETMLQQGIRPNTLNWGEDTPENYGTLYCPGSRPEQIVSIPGNYGHYYNGIYAALTEQKEPPVTATEGLRVMSIIDAAAESNKSGKLVKPNLPGFA